MPAVRSSNSSSGSAARSSRAAALSAAGCSAASVSAAERAVSSSSSSASSSRASPLAPLPTNVGLEPRVATDRNVRKPSPAQSCAAASEASTASAAVRMLSSRLESLKERGNEAFARLSYDEAYLYYTACIHLSPVPDPAFFLNRALLASRCQLYEQALYDARCAFRALEAQAQTSGLSEADIARVGSSWHKLWEHRLAKALLREGEALNALGRDPRTALHASLKRQPSEQAQTLLAQVEARCANPAAKPKFGAPVSDALALPWQLVACYGAQGLFPSEEEYEARLQTVKLEFRESSTE